MRTKQNFYKAPDPAAPHASFALRLQRSLLAAGVAVTGAASLEREFNQRYDYQPVARQTTYMWLTGKVRPTMDKIEVLAEWLQVSSHWLAYGPENGEQINLKLVHAGKRDSPNAAMFRNGVSPDQDGIEQMRLKLARLSPKQMLLIEALTDELLLVRQVG